MMNPLCVEKVLWLKPGEGISACGRIPVEAEFFQDHFPGFPILPGVLALEMLKQTAEVYLRNQNQSGAKRFGLKKISGVKFARYLKPGDEWVSHLEFVSGDEHETVWKGRLLHKEETAVTARLELKNIESPQFAVNL